jgi:iron(III) transport system substrate-binding protein
LTPTGSDGFLVQTADGSIRHRECRIGKRCSAVFFQPAGWIDPASFKEECVKRTRRLVAALVGITLGVTLSACGLGSASGGGDGDASTVTIYTSRPKAITADVVAGFEGANLKCKVQLLTLGAQEVADRIRAEEARPQADVWWGGTSQQFEQGVANDALEAFPQQIIDRVPQADRGTNNLWLGEQQLAQVIAYNHDMMSADQAPKDWDDLIDPQYQDKILIRDVAPSGTMRAIYSAMIDRTYETTGTPDQGYEFLLKLDANTKDYTANPTDLYLRIQRQEAPLTVWNLQDVLTQAQGGVPFTPVVPTSGSPILLDGVGKVKGAPNQACADAFGTYLLSEATQTMLAKDHFQIPTVQIAEQPAWLTDLNLHELQVNWDTIEAKSNEWIDYWVQHVKNQG